MLSINYDAVLKALGKYEPTQLKRVGGRGVNDRHGALPDETFLIKRPVVDEYGELAQSPVVSKQVESGPAGGPVIYWHRELPPLNAEAIGEHVVEATSQRVPGTLAHRDELWNQCYEDLMKQVRGRLEQEVVRLGGNYAHVLAESVDSKHSDAPTEAWLHGRFTYVLYATR